MYPRCETLERNVSPREFQREPNRRSNARTCSLKRLSHRETARPGDLNFLNDPKSSPSKKLLRVHTNRRLYSHGGGYPDVIAAGSSQDLRVDVDVVVRLPDWLRGGLMERKWLSMRGVRPRQRKGRHRRSWRLGLGPLRQLRRADSPRWKRVPPDHRPRPGSCQQNIII